MKKEPSKHWQTKKRIMIVEEIEALENKIDHYFKEPYATQFKKTIIPYIIYLLEKHITYGKPTRTSKTTE